MDRLSGGSESLRKVVRTVPAYRLAPFVALLVVSLVVHWTYLVEAGRPFYVDSDLPLTYQDYAVTYFRVWNPNLGHLNFAKIMRVPYVLPFWLLFRTLGIDPSVFAKFLFWLPTYLGMVSGYVFFAHFLGDGDAGRTASRRVVAVCLLLGTFYGLNPWIVKHIHQYYFRVSVAFLPFALMYFVEYARHGRHRDLILTTVFVVLVAMNPHFLLYFFGLAGLFALVDGSLSGRLVRSVGRTAAVGGTYVLASLFWLLPFGFITINGGASRGYNVGPRIIALYSMRNTPVNQFSFMGGYWPGITEFPWWFLEPVTPFQVVFLGIPIAAFACFLSGDRDDELALYSAVVILLMLPLSTGYMYFGWLYDAIVGLPFYEVLRAPARLTSFLPLLYGYLIGRSVLDADWQVVRRGALGLTVVVCVVLVAVNVHVASVALGPTPLPDDHRHVENADYEDAFVSPPRGLGGYNPEWRFSRTGGIVNSWDAHLYAYPDSQAQIFNYYVFELIDQNETGAAVSILRKTGGNHFVVRRDVESPDGIPPSNETISKLDAHPGVSREYTGEDLVVYDLDATDAQFRVVRPVPVERDVDAARHLADDPDAYPYFRGQPGTDRMIAELGAERLFHPSNMYARLNGQDVLSRPPTYDGVYVRDERTLTPPESTGTLVVRATRLGGRAEIVRETASGQEVYNLAEGNEWLYVDLEGEGRPLTFRGRMYVERLFVADDRRNVSRPVDTSFHGGGTITPNRTDLSLATNGTAVSADYYVRPGGGFWQVSFDPATPVDGSFTVRASVTAHAGDRFGVVLIREEGEALLYGSREQFRGGRQTVTIHVPDVPSAVNRIQFAVFPEDGPDRGRLTVHEFDVTSRPPDTASPAGRPACDADPTAERCEGAAEVTDVEQRGPGRYAVSVNASAPYALHFSEPHSKFWVAEVRDTGGGTYGSESLYSATNGFWIDETGRHTVVVRYQPQRWFGYGLSASAVVFLVFGGVLVYGRIRRSDALEGVPWIGGADDGPATPLLTAAVRSLPGVAPTGSAGETEVGGRSPAERGPTRSFTGLLSTRLGPALPALSRDQLPQPVRERLPPVTPTLIRSVSRVAFLGAILLLGGAALLLVVFFGSISNALAILAYLALVGGVGLRILAILLEGHGWPSER